ncbi:MAG TPA: cytochrome C oxidase subunit II, partial [Verrucomicrobiae bacterium]|nr:cytochrome C oxidase subunit II [Verrucomicrobiae bacterium]
MTHVSPTSPEGGADNIERVERRWAAFAIVLVVLLVVIAVFSGLHQASMPQSRVETVDPRSLHLGGEFIESNLGSA